MDIWTAIDRLAAAHGLSASGLAKRAGLDPTSFNPSKRGAPGGKLRWPTTESIAKILAATDTHFSNFVAMVERSDFIPQNPAELARANGKPFKRTVPLLGFAEANDKSAFDDKGFPTGSWEQIQIPTLSDPNAYALEVSGNSMEPVYRAGDVLIVSPKEEAQKGDRVVLKTTAGDVMVRELLRKTITRVDVRALNPAHGESSFGNKDVAWIAKVVWVSQ